MLSVDSLIESLYSFSFTCGYLLFISGYILVKLGLDMIEASGYSLPPACVYSLSGTPKSAPGTPG